MLRVGAHGKFYSPKAVNIRSRVGPASEPLTRNQDTNHRYQSRTTNQPPDNNLREIFARPSYDIAQNEDPQFNKKESFTAYDVLYYDPIESVGVNLNIRNRTYCDPSDNGLDDRSSEKIRCGYPC